MAPGAKPRETAGAVLFEIKLARAIRQATVSSADEDCLSTVRSRASAWIELKGISAPFAGIDRVVVQTRFLAGGNIQLHKPNPSTTGPSLTEDQITTACGGITGANLT